MFNNNFASGQRHALKGSNKLKASGRKSCWSLLWRLHDARFPCASCSGREQSTTASFTESLIRYVRLACRAVRSLSAFHAGEEGLGEHSPAFLWLLRDFYLQLEDEGGRKVGPGGITAEPGSWRAGKGSSGTRWGDGE